MSAHSSSSQLKRRLFSSRGQVEANSPNSQFNQKPKKPTNCSIESSANWSQSISIDGDDGDIVVVEDEEEELEDNSREKERSRSNMECSENIIAVEEDANAAAAAAADHIQSVKTKQTKLITAIELIRSNSDDSQDAIDVIGSKPLTNQPASNSSSSVIIHQEQNKNKKMRRSQSQDVSARLNRTEVKSRLMSMRATSKAMLLFRRAASVLKSSTSSNSVQSSANAGSPGNRLFENHLAGLPFQRQTTSGGDSSASQSQASVSKGAGSIGHYKLSSLIRGRAKLKSGSSSSSMNRMSNNPSSEVGAADDSIHQTGSTFVVPRHNALKMPLVCLVKSLNGELMCEVFVHRYEIGQHLLESLKVSIGLEDCKFFGLKIARSTDDQEDLRNPWLDLNESVWKQIKTHTFKGGFLSSAYNPGSFKKSKKNKFSDHQTKSTNSSSNNNNKQEAFINQHNNNSDNNNNNNNNKLLLSKSESSTTSSIITTSTNNNSSSSSSLKSIDFYLRIKYYPPNLARVQDTFLRDYLWLQLRHDLCLGKLISSMNNLTLLMACILQYEFGDYNQNDLDKIQTLNILPNQDLIEEQAIELWKLKFKNVRRHQAQMKFLRASIILETYGFDYHPVRDHQRQRDYLLGYNYAGIKTIRNGRIVHHMRWHSISKITNEGRMVIFHHHPTDSSKRKQMLGFKCLSLEDSRNLYIRLLEQKYFFTVDLAYFDKSVRRPSCLYSNQSVNGGTAPGANVNSNTQAGGSQPPPKGAYNNPLHNYPPASGGQDPLSPDADPQRAAPLQATSNSPEPTSYAEDTGAVDHEDLAALLRGPTEAGSDHHYHPLSGSASPLRTLTDEDFMEEAWIRLRQRKDASQLPSDPNTNQSDSTANQANHGNSRRKSSWPGKRLLGNCPGLSRLGALVESSLTTNAGQNPFNQHQQELCDSLSSLLATRLSNISSSGRGNIVTTAKTSTNQHQFQ